MTKNLEKNIKKAKSIEKKIEAFGDLIESLEKTEDKKKMLWKEVYENALYDRENANILLTDILLEIRGSVPLHTSLGSTATKYLERMSKSNDQILKLVELIAKEEEKNEISADDIFNQIGAG